MASRGQPTKLTRPLIVKIARLVAAGNYLDTAARVCGVSRVSFHHWMKRGHDQQRGIFREFLNAMEEAQAKADVRDHAFIAKASGKDWRAAVEHLRLRNQARYGARRLEISGPDGRAIQTESSASAGLLDLFRKLAGDGGEGGER